VGSEAVTTVAVAIAVIVVSATDVAVIVTTPAVPGAVYTPFASIEPIEPTVPVVGTVQVTARHWLFTTDWSHPGLLTLAVKGNVSLVPTVAAVGLTVMLIPEMIVTVAVAVLVLSACEVAVIVAVGVIVVVPLFVTVGTVFGAV
jgi:hypothetical protein